MNDGSNGVSSRKPYAKYTAYAIANPGATIADMLAAFPQIAPSTIRTQFRLTSLYRADPLRSARQARAVALGDAGEIDVVNMLTQHGWTVDHVNSTKRNVALIDLRATKNERTIDIQVKASRSYSAPLKQANALDHVWFVVIDNRGDFPRYYVLSGRDLTPDVYYRSPNGGHGRIRLKRLTAFENRWDLLM
jgi:hypothetical protein